MSSSSTDALHLPPAAESGTALPAQLAAALLLGAIALLPRLLWLDAAPHLDELYHLLGAAGLLATGEPVIAGGVYERAYLFTTIVAWTQSLISPGLEAARLPSVAAGVALVVAVFLWLWRVAGPVAAWTGGLILALAPLAVELSQLARFYALHALLFWLAAIAVYDAVQEGRGPGRRAALAIGATALLAVALHLQPLTAIGALGLAGWLAILAAPMVVEAVRVGSGRLRAIAAGAGLLALALLAGVLRTDLPAMALAELRHAPLWAAEFKDQVHFYHLRLAHQYPILWPLTGLLALAALGRFPRAAGFCLTVFVTAFVVGSLGGMKDDRYLHYALPFLFGVWALAVAALADRAVPALMRIAGQAGQAVAPWAPRRMATTVALGAAALFALSAGSGPAMLAFDLVRDREPEGAGRVSRDWWHAAPALRDIVNDAHTVVVSNELAALAALGRADVVVNGSRLTDFEVEPEFAADRRTGARMVSTPASLDAIMGCSPDGVILLAEGDLRHAWAVSPAALEAIEARATPLALAGHGDLRVLTWRSPGADPATCPAPLTPVTLGGTQ